MGLLTILAGKARELGMGNRVVASLTWVTLVVALSSVAWISVLPLEGQFRNTYISENALLPHGASTHYRETEWHILRGIRNQLREWKDLETTERNQNLVGLFDEFGLTTSQTDGTVYAILHAPRGSHNEAIVVVAPWLVGDNVYNDGGVGLLYGLARFFKQWSIWHKNLVFVVPETGNTHLRKWVYDYHTNLQHTAGSVEGAIVLDFSSTGENFDHMEVLYEGFNGQLPNLDLVNTAVEVCRGEWVRPETGASKGTGAAHNRYEARLRALVDGIWNQVIAGSRPIESVQGPGSAMFSGWRIDAITLKAVFDENGGGAHDVTTFGRVGEGVVRSVNNLLEHFHQSFFFYLTMGPYYFVSIASYLPSAMLIANSFPLMALNLALNTKSSPPLKEWAKAAVSLGMALTACVVSGSIYLHTNHTWSLALPLTVLALPRQGGIALHAIVLVTLGLILTTLAMLNFGFALVLGLACFPLAWLRPKRAISNSIIVAISCPATILAVLASVAKVPLDAVLRGIAHGHSELNVWTGTIVVCVWYTAWIACAAAYF